MKKYIFKNWIILLLALTIIAFGVLFFSHSPETSQQAPHQQSAMGKFFDAIELRETGSGLAKGLAGEIGPYQIRECYWIDSGIPGNFEMCWNKEYSQKVMINYWKRYCLKAMTDQHWETMARIHNGGPQGHKKQATIAYWEFIRSKL